MSRLILKMIPQQVMVPLPLTGGKMISLLKQTLTVHTMVSVCQGGYFRNFWVGMCLLGPWNP